MSYELFMLKAALQLWPLWVVLAYCIYKITRILITILK
jgi:hypothetical protein